MWVMERETRVGERSLTNLQMGDNSDFCGFVGSDLGCGSGTTLGISDIDCNGS